MSVDDIVTVNNIKRAWGFLLGNIDYPVDWQYIREYNRIIGEGRVRDAGRLREYGVRIGGTGWVPEIPTVESCLLYTSGTCFAGSEWFAGEVDRMEADRINGGQPEETDGLVSEGPRIPFIVEAEATAADTDEPPLDELITAATRE